MGKIPTSLGTVCEIVSSPQREAASGRAILVPIVGLYLCLGIADWLPMNDKVHTLNQLCSHDLEPTFPFFSGLFIEPVFSLSWAPWLFLAPGIECPTGH